MRLVQDKVGNLVVYRPGSAGGEKAPAVIVQGEHLPCKLAGVSKHRSSVSR